MTKERLWTPAFVINMGLNFVYYFAYYMLTVIIGTVSIVEMHATTAMAGFLSGIFILGGFVGRLWIGSVIGRLGAKKSLYIGSLIFLFFTFPYYVVHNALLMLALRFLHGIGFGIAATASGALAGMIVPASRRGEGIGYYALSVTMASAIGPFLSIFLYHAYGFSVLIDLALALSVAALIGIFFLKMPANLVSADKTSSQKLPADKKTRGLSAFIEKKALPIAGVGFLVGIVYSSVLTFMAGYSASIHLVSAGSLFYVIYAVFILLSRPIAGRLFDQRGENFVLYPAFLLLGLSLLVTGLSTNTAMLLSAGALLGLGYGSFPPFGQSVAIREAGIARVGMATSTFYGLLDIGVGLGPLILGLVEPSVGYRGMYFLAAAFVFVIIILYFSVHGRFQKSWYRRFIKAKMRHQQHKSKS
ncbi:MAG: MFS transporter [Streptococcaceae bacterium]|jgi:MFS family permease|nr:MFS transporter [Streptococcaceae bacterium]